MIYRFQNFVELAINSNGRRQFDSYFENEYDRIDRTNKSEGIPGYNIFLEIVGEIPADT